MENKKKISRSTKSQLKILTDYMATHRAFANNEYTGPLGNNKYLAEWEALRSVLREHGPDKSIEQWRHTWRDIKKKARNEVAIARRASAQTGNNTVVPIVSDSSLQVLDTIGHECASGIGGEESQIGTVEIGIVPPPAAFAEVETSLSVPHLAPHSNQAGPSRIPATPARPCHQAGPSRLPATPARPCPTPGVAQRRRMGLGVRAKEFLKAEEATTNVLKDIHNQMIIKNTLMEEQNELLKKFFNKKDNTEE